MFGPVLHLRGFRAGEVRVRAVAARAASEPVRALSAGGEAVPARLLFECDGLAVDAYDFALPAGGAATYVFDDETFPVTTDFEGDLRIAYVSCNGQEHGDRKRPLEQRDALWRRLCREHEVRPFQLLLHGGDQLYADEIVEAQPASRRWLKHKRRTDGDTEAAAAALEDELRRALFRRYLELFDQTDIAWIAARVPSLAMWDDHDICDGWGSLHAGKLDSPVGRTIFRVAREQFLLFQMGAVGDDLPDICLDADGETLSWQVRLPGLHVVAPDLRSERRPDRVMGKPGWRALETAGRSVSDGHVILLSSVPALGPRLSWLEAVLHLCPGMQKYEDDLRDQWQSRAHRSEWRRFLEWMLELHRRAAVTVLSGEIHLATRATMDDGDRPVNQLVASGIAHPAPPRGWARGLGLLARFGEAPLPEHPIRLRPLPGRRSIYADQRNYLVLERHDGTWSARWELEREGPTPPLDL